MRLLSLAALVLLVGTATAADPLPKDITTEARAEIIKKWQPAYEKAKAEWEAKLEDAKAKVKEKPKDDGAKKKLAEATTAVKNLETKPWAVPDSPFQGQGNPRAAKGTVVVVESPQTVFIATEQRSDGVLIEGKTGAGTIELQYLIASPLPVPKAVGKKPPAVTLPGLWYWADDIDVKGKPTPVLYKFELKPGDFPKAK